MGLGALGFAGRARMAGEREEKEGGWGGWCEVSGGSKWAFYLSPVPQPPGAEERPPKLKYSGVYTPD